MPVLHLGNKNYSSWSLRPWLVLRWAGIRFDEDVIRLGSDGYGQGRMPEILAKSPSGRVPALQVGGDTVWDSLSISLWAAERVPELWPADPRARAECRSVVCEMHSGFAGVRRDLSMNLRRRMVVPRPLSDDTEADLARLAEMWTGLRARYGGPWLFGERSIADAFYAPVATRLRSYGVVLRGNAAAWSAALFADPDFREWEAAAVDEPWRIEDTDQLHNGAPAVSIDALARVADRAFFAALLASDDAQLEALLTPDFFTVDVDGSVTPRGPFVDAVRTGVLEFESIVPERSEVRVYGDAAVVVGATRMRLRVGDQPPVEVHSRYTHLFVGGASGLRLASAQSTPLPPLG